MMDERRLYNPWLKYHQWIEYTKGTNTLSPLEGLAPYLHDSISHLASVLYIVQSNDEGEDIKLLVNFRDKELKFLNHLRLLNNLHNSLDSPIFG